MAEESLSSEVGILGVGDRARWGASGALYPQPALAGPMLARGAHGPETLRARSEEGRVPRDANLRTPSGPEGSSGKRALAGAAGTPGRSHRPVERPSRALSTASARSPTLFLRAGRS